MKQSLPQFFTLVKNFTQVQGLALKGAAIIPLICIWTEFGPPHSAIRNAFTSIVELIALIAIFQMTYGRSPQILRKLSLMFGLLFAVTAAACTYFAEVYVLPVNGGKDRVVIGTQLRDDIAKMIGPVYSSPEEALRDGSNHPDSVWTSSSVQRVTLLYELDWILMLLFFTAAIVTFVMASENDQQGDISASS